MAKKVILVDDSKTILATAQMALDEMVQNGGVILALYQNPAELLNLLMSGNENFDMLISDINMPQMNGLDLAATLKADERLLL